VATLLRELAPLALAAVLRRWGGRVDFALCEDAVQEALLQAAQQWPAQGVPANPRGWLIVVAGRRMTDRVRAESARAHREELVVSLVPPDDQVVLAMDHDDVVHERDDTLELLFLSCHPALTGPSAVALTLRAVGGLTTAEIARAFVVPEATMAQRISRAKALIQGAGGTFPAARDAAEGQARLTSVLRVLYLMFNEGYAASSGTDVVRVDLSNEAIRLARLLLRVVSLDRRMDHGEAAGLLALMLLTDARRAARMGPNGELVPLDEQDRATWDRALIHEGTRILAVALQQSPPGPYRLQAAVAALHDEAASTDATDWAQIAALYEVLVALEPNPMVALNHAVAVAMVQGPRAGLVRVDALAAADPRLAQHHRLAAVRAHLLERAGDLAEAAEQYAHAAAGTMSVAERDYLMLRGARLRPSS
jgi:predicted RNA polymerase sigma factor